MKNIFTISKFKDVRYDVYINRIDHIFNTHIFNTSKRLRSTRQSFMSTHQSFMSTRKLYAISQKFNMLSPFKRMVCDLTNKNHNVLNPNAGFYIYTIPIYL